MEKYNLQDLIGVRKEMKVERIKIDMIEVDQSLQQRNEINKETVDHYLFLLQEQNADFPPVKIVRDEALQKNYLVDGFHRLESFKLAGIIEIDAEIKEGNKRDALLESVRANQTHGLRRSNLDKRRALATLLKDEEWRGWSNGILAEIAGVSAEFVRKLKEEQASSNHWEMSKTIKTTRNGRLLEMKKPVQVEKSLKNNPAVNEIDTSISQSDTYENESDEDYNYTPNEQISVDCVDDDDEDYSSEEEFSDYILKIALEKANEQYEKLASEVQNNKLAALIKFTKSRKIRIGESLGDRDKFYASFLKQHLNEIVAHIEGLPDEEKWIFKKVVTSNSFELYKAKLKMDFDSLKKQEIPFSNADQFNAVCVKLINSEVIGLLKSYSSVYLNDSTKELFLFLMRNLGKDHPFYKAWFKSSQGGY